MNGLEPAIATTLEFDDLSLVPLLYGEHNSHITYIEKTLDVQISDRGNTLSLSGNAENTAIADNVLKWMWKHIQKGRELTNADIDGAIRFAQQKNSNEKVVKMNGKPAENSPEQIALSTRKKSLVARTPTQAKYIQALRHNEMIFGIGPAGTGKTYLAVAAAVEMYEQNKIDRLVFTRPAVEAGEKLGFLPGDMREKIDPYLRPIYDALYDFLGAERVEKMLERGEIEIAPLAFMRGRTLSRAYVLLDEAQNTTTSQMKMFLSRMGEDTRMVITGDPSQTDLLNGQTSGLKEALLVLSGISDIAIVEFNNKDVVRHKLVGKILQAYDESHL